MLRERIKQMDLDFFAAGGPKIGLDAFLELWKKGEAILLDVRFEEEVELFKVGFGINIPLYKLPENLERLPKDKLIVTFCPEKVRATLAYSYLVSEGFENVKVLSASPSDIIAKVKPGFIKKLKEEKE
ncbi:rhodanese-like domain-containing protein [Phorcysia thermohydrogeniphila]|uniref:Rhodanese-related sulfurtransferase n=1 Tax=Phorcysia thermohydrogeniphila TaxID=936138 RepID=A0A4R1GHY4_9BACT|nr:rhodanese-like domain-containing protein [Phorcysia thermohydrogeniphila]TCK06415.1 rhodanese-related sulfurtransferase [Phorcysia thermohydrogeniphila]